MVEEGSEGVRLVMAEGDQLSTSRLAYAEIHAPFARRRREGDLSRASYAAATRSFEADWRGMILVDLSDEVLRRTRALVGRHPLRAADAVHLALALWLSDMLGRRLRFLAADARLLRAAGAERLETFAPTDTESAQS